MKKITFLFLLLVTSLGYSQVVLLEDYDGTAPTVIWDQDNGNASAVVSTTQAVSGTNSLELITTDAGAPWQGAKLLMQNNKIDMRDATTGVGTNKIVTFQLYSDAPRRFLLKLSNGDVGETDPAQESKTAVAHPGGGWNLMTADFTMGADLGQPGYNPPNDQFSSIIFFPLFAVDGSDGWDVCCDPNIAMVTTSYIDDVSSWAGDAIVPPIADPEAAPLPNAPDGETYSIYNDTNNYSTVFPVSYDFGTLGGEPDLDPGADENKALKFDFTFAGWGQGEGGPDDVSAYGFVNFMYWAEPGVPGFQFRMISNDGAVLEYVYEIGTQEAIVTGQWTQVSIPMTYFTNLGFSSANFYQWKCEAFMQVVTDPGAVYMDNIILTLNALSIDEFATTEFKVYPNPAITNWTISGNSPITKVTVYDVLGKKISTITSNENEVEVSTTGMNAGMYFAKVESINGSKTVRLIKE